MKRFALLICGMFAVANSGLAVEPGSEASTASMEAYAYFGVEFQWSRRESENEQIVVVRVADGGPAAKAGIKAGDVITQVMDVPVAFGDELDFLLFMRERAPGERLTVRLLRMDAPMTLVVVLGRLPEEARERWEEGFRVAREKREAARRSRGEVRE